MLAYQQYIFFQFILNFIIYQVFHIFTLFILSLIIYKIIISTSKNLSFVMINQPSYHQYIADEAFLFFPNEKQMKHLTTRRIFEGNIKFDETQQKHLIEFEKYLIKNKKKIDRYWDNAQRIRFLQSTGYNYEKTVKDMEIYVDWYYKEVPRKAPQPLILKYLQAGVFYCCGRDSQYRPIYIFDVQKMQELVKTTEELLQTQTQFFLFGMQHFLLPGQVENWVAIIDLNYANLFSVIGTLKQSITFLSSTFRSRMYRCYNVRCPGSISFLWNIVKRFMDEETIKKMSFYDESIPTPIFQDVNKQQIQTRFGGTKPEIKQFWPPQRLQGNFEVNDSKKRLISKAEYKKMYKDGKLKDKKINLRLIQQQKVPETVQEILLEQPLKEIKPFTIYPKPASFKCS